ncbi:hypothetical protein DMA11_20560 [Marinilabiliaceae bacterium JC017]|nr:hypothetical protein DMA11_20560 [Marinilabiliaceae bacterium JC017]
MNIPDLQNKIKKTAHSLLFEKGYICAVDMLIKLDYLTQKDYQAWRLGKVSYLEKACKVNLSKLSTINSTTKKIAKELQLKESWTAYNQYGKGPKRRLIFSKSGDNNIEKAYATHYLDVKRINELKTNKTNGL